MPAAFLALIMSLGYYFVVRNMGALKYTSGAAGIFTAVVIIATFNRGCSADHLVRRADR